MQVNAKKGKMKKTDVDNLKEELTLTEHKLSLQELAERLGTNLTTVNYRAYGILLKYILK